LKIIKNILIGLITLLVVSVAGLFIYLNASQDEPHFAGRCEALELNDSAEDMQIDRERGFVYLSLIDRGALARGEAAQGTVGRINLNGTDLRVEKMLLDPPDHFRPHGLSLYIDEDGKRSLAVINHPVDRGVGAEHVELFAEESPGQFRHVRSFTDELIARPNDLVAVGHEQYYVANDSPPNSGQLTNLVYVDRDNARVVADDIASGGGINVSRDLNQLYVAETGAQRIRVLDRNPTDGRILSDRQILIGTAPDNIDVAEDGSLWVGAHSSLLGLVLHFVVGTDAPSQVMKITLDSAGNDTVDEIYLNRGEEISASSVGVTYGNKLLIGSITAPKILICEMD
jgi:arylesterase/paraoxonase